MSVSVLYRLRPLAVAAHVFDVTLTVSQPAKKGQVFRLPVWIPGSYMIREFARHIVTIKAQAGGKPVALCKLDKQSWQADPVEGPLVLNYQVYAYDLSVRGAYLDQQRGFFNGTSVFLSVDGYEQSPCDVVIERPRGKDFHDWRLATSLTSRDDAKDLEAQHGFGRYRAQSYDELIDHPVEMGRFEQVEFKACGVPHRFVVSGRFNADLKRLARDVKRICEWHIKLFGQPAPFDRYVFMLFVGAEIYGGLEHRSSTALMAERADLPARDVEGISDGYLRLLGLISHEYFHSWNVKRIKPAAFVPYDLTQVNYTRLLWAFEGVTSYYDDLALLRCGLIDAPRYLGLLAQTFSMVERANGRNKQTLEDSSFDAWIKYYRQDENSPNSQVSYYTKGALVALALDLLIRRQSHQSASLDDVMRALWTRWRQTQNGVAEDEWEHLAGEVTGLNLQPFFESALRSTEVLPLVELLASQGIKLEFTAAQNGADRGGFYADAQPVSIALGFGAKGASDALGVKLVHVHDGGAAQTAGLSAGDVVVALDGLRVSQPDQLSACLCAGRNVAVHAFRRDELMTFDLTPAPASADTCRLSPLGGAPGAWPMV